MSLKDFFLDYFQKHQRSIYADSYDSYIGPITRIHIEYDPAHLHKSNLTLLNDFLTPQKHHGFNYDFNEVNFIFHQISKSNPKVIIEAVDFFKESPFFNSRLYLSYLYKSPLFLDYLLIPEVINKLSLSSIKKNISYLGDTERIEKFVNALLSLEEWQDKRQNLIEVLKEKKQYSLYNKLQSNKEFILSRDTETKVDTFIVNYTLMKQQHHLKMDESSLDKLFQSYLKSVLIGFKKIKSKDNFIDAVSFGLTRVQISDKRKVYIDHHGKTEHAEIFLSNLIENFIVNYNKKDEWTLEQLNAIIEKTDIMIHKNNLEKILDEAPSSIKVKKI